MVRTQRTTPVLVTSTVILLSITVGLCLGMVPQQEWDLLVARLQGSRIISVVPASNAQVTLYVLDADQPVRREVLVDLRLPGNGHDAGLASVPVWLTMGLDAVEMPLDDNLALRMELVPYTSPEEWPDLHPSMRAAQVPNR
jgi:hypothetical protein